MANYDNPNGFKPVSPRVVAKAFTCSADVTAGDILALVSGQVLPFDLSTHNDAVGVALTSALNGGTVIASVDPECEYSGQVATGTSYAAATHNGGRYDVTGTTGIQEVELGTQTKGILQILAHAPVPGSLDVGAHARVRFKIAQHALASLPAYDPGTATFGAVSTDTITEKTSGAGVTIDGTLIKDLRITIGAAAGSGETVTPKFGCVAATPSNAAGWGKGSLIVDLSDGKVKTNTGTDASVTWTVVGTQS